MIRRTVAAALFMAVVAATLVSGASPAGAATSPRSTFDADVEGWKGDTDGSQTFGTWSAGQFHLQIPGGDPDNTYFNAPPKFRGNQSAFLGGELSFEVNTDPSPVCCEDPEPFDDVVRIWGNSTFIGIDADPTFGGRARVGLEASAGWTVVGGGPVSESQFAAILADVDLLFIRAEYFPADEEDVPYGILDNVRLGFPNGASDFSGDGLPDRTLFRPAFEAASWHVPGGPVVTYGTTGDLPVVGDYDGDGTADEALFRPSTNRWYLRGIGTFPFGTTDDIPVPGDYDGDGITDMAVFRPSTGRWHLRNINTIAFGTNGDIPVPGDYDVDGDTDLAVFRPASGTWHVQGIRTTPWGTSGDIPVPGHYVTRTELDLAVFRPSTGTWHIRAGERVAYGAAGDIPVPADYDGDGDTDLAVYRPSTGTLHVRGVGTFPGGQPGDIPTLERPSVRLARMAAVPLLTAVEVPTGVRVGENGVGTVRLSGPAQGNTKVALVSSTADMVVNDVTVPSGATSATFPIQATDTADDPATVQATLGGDVLVSSGIDLLAADTPSTIISFTVDATMVSIYGGGTVGRVTLDYPAPYGLGTGQYVETDSSNPFVAGTNDLHIPQGSRHGTFSIFAGGQAGTATISAQASGPILTQDVTFYDPT